MVFVYILNSNLELPFTFSEMELLKCTDKMEKQQRKRNGNDKLGYPFGYNLLQEKRSYKITSFLIHLIRSFVNLMVECARKRVHWHAMTIEKNTMFQYGMDKY